MKPTRVGTRELKNRLSRYLRRVKAGETVIITEHGTPVGQIIPIEADLTGRLKALAEAGVLQWNGTTLKRYRPTAINRGKQLLSELIAAERE